jgi:hypothetical protein
MKKVLIALNIAIWSLVTYQVAHAEAPKAQEEKVCKVNPETKKETCTKKVCHVDEKTKKEVCKVIKVHAKLEGTAVPEKDKKK